LSLWAGGLSYSLSGREPHGTSHTSSNLSRLIVSAATCKLTWFKDAASLPGDEKLLVDQSFPRALQRASRQQLRFFVAFINN